MLASAVPTHERHESISRRQGVLEAICFGVVLSCFFFSWYRFPIVWSENREHGFLIAGICGWVAWQERSNLLLRDEPIPLVAGIVFGLSMVWMLAVGTSVQVVHLIAAPLLLLAWVLAVRGRRAVVAGLPLAAAFSLAIPIWEVLTTPLQHLTVLVNRVALSIVDINATITGTAIQLPSGTLVVAESCAGLNYLMSGLSLGAAYALLFSRNRYTQLKLVLAAGAISIVSNWIRVFGLVLVGHFTQMQSSLMRDHVVYGWIIFAATIPLFAFVATRIERSEGVDLSSAVSIEPSPTGAVATPDRWPVLLTSAAAICGPLLLLITTMTHTPGPVTEAVSGIRPSTGWEQQSASSARWSPGFSGASEHRDYVWGKDGNTVQVDRYIYSAQTQQTEMVGAGNNIAPDSLILRNGLVGPLDANLRMARELIVADSGTIRLAWTWFRAADIETPSGLKAKFLEFWGIFTGAPPSELLVVSSACEKTDCTRARAAVYELVVGQPIQPAPAR